MNMTAEELQLAIRHYGLDVQRLPLTLVWENGDTDYVFQAIALNKADGRLWLTLDKTSEVVNPPGS